MIRWHYWGMMLIMLFNMFWAFPVSPFVLMDMRLIGHLRGWRKIRLPRELDYSPNMNNERYRLLDDRCTHPQTIVLFAVHILLLCCFITLTICIWFIVNDLGTWVLWTIVIPIYDLGAGWAILVHEKATDMYTLNLGKMLARM